MPLQPHQIHLDVSKLPVGAFRASFGDGITPIIPHTDHVLFVCSELPD
ncbi:hypothetical protein MMEU_1473 [Mycobacterium marinum str. Europe]|nr:hypothetical protein MMEU_1473 [Mycobacterium marinum str. Europe]